MAGPGHEIWIDILHSAIHWMIHRFVLSPEQLQITCEPGEFTLPLALGVGTEPTLTPTTTQLVSASS